ncbi:MAG TPA: porin [Noviherbaspirillum sp.]|uniref:porin n=1 Tax=Noviherbaspirillum sp. TaxID=1926288 RepID=UPI002B49BB28|nr:porin [Noviherbaspirillum sp.]HJV84083.1 porin [Noviherbaspirillum sp.]
MKKTLLALAVMGALAGTASAQSNVTVYGVLDIALNVADNGASANSRTISLDNGTQLPSRIGFKGVEDLGGGLSASFQLENGFNSDSGAITQTGRLFGRQAWVGLNGAFGSVKFGRQWAPLFLALAEIDPFEVGLAGDASLMFGSGTYPLRTDNTVNYSLPAMNGLTGQVSYILGETPGSTSANRQYGVGLGYANGPINVQFGYHNANSTNTTVAPATVADAKHLLLGGVYDFGVVKAHLGYGDSTRDSTVAGSAVKDRNWMAGLSAPIGVGTLMFSYIRNNVRNVANADSTMLALGYSHALSKRTSVYTSYSHTSNEANAAMGGAAANGNDTSLFNVGIRHKF